LVLAPMANVTDAAFRRLIAAYGKPDVMYTEFVSVDGLLSDGRERLLPDLWFTEAERPIVAQFFGAKPEYFYRCALLAQELGFDGIDINMGCPDRAVEKQGAGAALMKNPELAKKIITETKRGAGTLPVSVKTRIGYRSNVLQTWLRELLSAEPVAVTIHLRTREEMSLVPAHWEFAREAVAIRNEAGSKTLLLGNGDVKSRGEAIAKSQEYELDGVMIGRGVFGSPWLFNPQEEAPLIQNRLRTLVEHTELFERLFRSDQNATRESLKNFDIMKKHYKAYVHGFEGANELRIKLMAAEGADEVRRIITDFLKTV